MLLLVLMECLSGIRLGSSGVRKERTAHLALPVHCPVHDLLLIVLGMLIPEFFESQLLKVLLMLLKRPDSLLLLVIVSYATTSFPLLRPGRFETILFFDDRGLVRDEDLAAVVNDTWRHTSILLRALTLAHA